VPSARWLALLAFVLESAIIPGPAHATPESEAAQRLFREAKALMEAGEVHAACSMLADARQLELGGGIVLMLAVCHEKEGRGASALAEFREARALAVAAQREDRVKLAEAEIVRLEARVSRLTVVAPEGMEVRVNREPWDRARLGVAVAVDAGEYVVRGEAAGKAPWEVTASVAAEGDSRTIEVPPLNGLDAPLVSLVHDPSAPLKDEPAPGVAVAKADPGRARVTGFALGGVGVAGVGVAAAFGILAAADRRAADCGGVVCPNKDRTYRDAQTAATVATVAGIVGGVGLGASALLLLTSHAQRGTAPPKAAVQVVPQISLTGGSIGITGSF
jgi:hypothetical protein